jgi:putative ATP-binding cassette transporter
MIGLFTFLLRRSWRISLISGTFGALAALATTKILALINELLRGPVSDAAVRFFAFAVTMWVATFGSDYVMLKLGLAFGRDTQIRFASNLTAVPLRRVESVGAATIYNVLTGDVNGLRASLTAVAGFNLYIGMTILFLGYIALISWKLFAATLLALIFGIALNEVARRRAEPTMRRARFHNDELTESLRTLTDGMKELKLHRGLRDDILDNALRPAATAYAKQGLRAQAILELVGPIGFLMPYAIVVAALVWGRRFVQLDDAAWAGYALTVSALVAPANKVLLGTRELIDGKIALSRIEALDSDLLGGGELEKRRTAELAAAEPCKMLELSGIEYEYIGESGEKFVLGPINLEIFGGQLTFIVGGNGSGKSTLAKVLVGLYEPTRGKVRLNGRTIDAESLEWFRSHFAVTFFDFFLTRRLVGFFSGRPVDDARAMQYLRLLELDQKVKVRDGVLSTINLSQGQRKRLALLTAYLQDRPIYLFDEWAADQDPHFKEIFYRKLLPAMKAEGKAVIVITHDDRYFAEADSIVKLDRGKIVDEGTEQFSTRLRTGA